MKDVQVLVTEMFKVQNNCSPEIMKNIFLITEAIYNYNLGNISNFTSCRMNKAYYESESLSYLGQRM